MSEHPVVSGSWWSQEEKQPEGCSRLRPQTARPQTEGTPLQESSAPDGAGRIHSAQETLSERLLREFHSRRAKRLRTLGDTQRDATDLRDQNGEESGGPNAGPADSHSRSEDLGLRKSPCERG